MKNSYLSIVLTLSIVAIAGCIGQQPAERVAEMVHREPLFNVTESDVNYFDGAVGFLAQPEEPGDYPGIVLIHEWWGLNDNIKDMAREFAGQGYVALAVDLFDGSVATTSDGARAQVSALNQTEALENMRAAVQYLRDVPDADKVASLGWCFGGGQSMQLALNDGVDATVIYYGNLVTDEQQLMSIEQPVLGIFGDADRVIPVASVHEFDSALDSVGIENEIYVYEGVGHAFANPSGQNYAPEETLDAWGKTLDFLNRHMKSSN